MGVEVQQVEHVFEVHRATNSDETREDAPKVTPVTLSEGGDQAWQRRAEARREGRHPAPLNEGRSRNMQANRRRDTGPELALRSALHSAGYRYRCDLRLDVDGVRVRPDIVFTKRKVAVFVDGCFWHSCPEHGRRPTTNEYYWSPKLQRNVERDLRNTAALEHAGWTVIRLWEHEGLDAALRMVAGAVDSKRSVSGCRGSA
jgi:DNA mismatch endonuclease (patch repair protein)